MHQYLGITNKWAYGDDSDPGVLLVKLMAILGDLLFYQLDMENLEVYPSTVTLRKNAATIYKLIGYKMRWYQSAIVEANVVNTFSNAATLPRFCTFTTENNETTYTTFQQYELPSNMTNNGLETLIELVQGIPVTPVRSSNSPYPDTGKPWHDIYGYNYTTDDIIDNRIYLDDTDIDESHIILIDDKNEQWELRDNIYLTTNVGRLFEFGIDVNDKPYIELIDYWPNFNISKFKLFYIKSKGEEGQIYANTLKYLTGNVWSRSNTTSGATIYNVSDYIHFTNYDSTIGYNPETPDEARKNSVMYQNTLDTLITLADFERATLREPGVSNVRATDLTNDPGEIVNFAVGNINMDYIDSVINEDTGETVRSDIIDQLDVTTLTNYLAQPDQYPLSSYQLKLADCNGDGLVDSKDLACLNAYLDGDYENAGNVGTKHIEETKLLDSFVVKLYILRNEAWADTNDEAYITMIQSDLQEYKILPLTIEVDLHSINQYYWSIQGKFLTKQPLSRDELQTIIVNINNNLRYQYSTDKVNFNTAINYKDVIELILNTDNRILMVDLEPITYKDSLGNEISKSQLTAEYQITVPKNNTGTVTTDLIYHIQLDNTPILPGTVMIRVNNGKTVLTDDKNGQIYNTDNILVRKGDIDYYKGTIDLEFVSAPDVDLVVNYIKNETNVAVYRNLSTNEFYFDTSALLKDDVKSVF